VTADVAEHVRRTSHHPSKGEEAQSEATEGVEDGWVSQVGTPSERKSRSEGGVEEEVLPLGALLHANRSAACHKPRPRGWQQPTLSSRGGYSGTTSDGRIATLRCGGPLQVALQEGAVRELPNQLSIT